VYDDPTIVDDIFVNDRPSEREIHRFRIRSDVSGVRGHDVDNFNDVGIAPIGYSRLATGMSRLIANLGRRTNEPTLTFLCRKQCQLPLLRLGFEREFPMNAAPYRLATRISF
jgi:hypothetical protein